MAKKPETIEEPVDPAPEDPVTEDEAEADEAETDTADVTEAAASAEEPEVPTSPPPVPPMSKPTPFVETSDMITVIARMNCYARGERYVTKGTRFRILESDFNPKVHERVLAPTATEAT